MINKELEEYIKDSKNILIISSLPLDPDCVCSGLILRKYLQSIGKENVVNVISKKITNEIMNSFSFLPYFSELEFKNPLDIIKEREWDTLFLLDGANLIQFYLDTKNGAFLELDKFKKIIHIDHHLNRPEKLGTFEIHSSNESSTTEIVLNHIIPDDFIDKKIATLGYAGIVGDTGNFKWAIYPSTFKLAGLLLEKGANYVEIIDKFIITRSLARFKAVEWIMNNLEFQDDIKTLFLVVTQKKMKENSFTDKDFAVLNDTFIEDISKNIEGYDRGISMKEEVDGNVHVSARGNNLRNKVSLPDLFKGVGGNGGGHFNASGMRLVGNIDDVKNKIIESIKNSINSV